MTSIQRIGLVAVLVVALAGGAALFLRAGEADDIAGGDAASMASSLGEDAAPAGDEGTSHLGRVALPESDTLRADDMFATQGGFTQGGSTQGGSGPRVVQWEDLLPGEGEGRPVVFAQGTAERAGMPTRADFGDISDEELAAFVGDIDDMRSMQPTGAAIRTDLDGVTIRLAGYATPLGFDQEDVTEFLLVPWLGACIHTPPPAANQIVYATEAEGLDVARMWEPIWVTGTLRADPTPTVLADVGYRIENARVEAYE